ncbi:helix-turn-helix domain-containing protein [Bradyrhizobium sp. USDA 10063]
MGQFAKLQTRRVESFEELSDVIAGSQREIVQIESGKVRGGLTHASINGLPIDVGTFNVGMRSRGGSKRDRMTVCMLTGATNRVTRGSYESHPGDVMVTAPGGEQENRYYGGASVFAISPTVADIEASFGTEAQQLDASAWCGHLFAGTADTTEFVIPQMHLLIDRLGQSSSSLTEEASEFWKRAIIEAMTASVIDGVPSVRDGPTPSSLKLIRRVEEYLETQGARPIHISQICDQLRVSRRTLHRAFHEALGIGPIAFLRYRRLCAVHKALRSGILPNETIADLALQFGFLNVGRFAQYYRELFGEYPSDTKQRGGGTGPSGTGEEPQRPDFQQLF